MSLSPFEEAIKKTEEKGAEVGTHYPSLFTCLVGGHDPPCIRCVKCKLFIRPENMKDLCQSSVS